MEFSVGATISFEDTVEDDRRRVKENNELDILNKMDDGLQNVLLDQLEKGIRLTNKS